MIEIEIDGKKLAVNAGESIIAAADRAGIYIPRFCYHKKLSVAANCRMCLVEVERAPKALPACATPVSQGMKVFTQSAKTIAAQRAVMEFLLINHPLDCPICDQGGECELQDLALGFGEGVSRYNEGKRSVVDKNLGSLVATDMTRCINCTRCVRFSTEIAGVRELGAVGRGDATRIGTYIEKALQSELSGGLIDVCPVGALTNKPYRYTSRAWEMQQHASISPHDCVGSNLYLHSRKSEHFNDKTQIMRVVPRENEAINETWLADRDRYSCYGLSHGERLLKPRIKEKGRWREVDWETAFKTLAHRLKKVITKNGGEQLGGLISPSASMEEHYLLAKCLRQLGSANIDHRLHQTDFDDEASAVLPPSLGGLAIADIERLDTALLLGSYLRHEQPLLNHRLLKAVNRGASVCCLNTMDYDFNYKVAHKIISSPQQLVATVAQLLKACAELQPDAAQASTVNALLKPLEVSEQARQMAIQLIKADGKKAIFLGAQALNHHEAATIKRYAALLAAMTGAHLARLTTGANAAGACLAASLPAASSDELAPGKHTRAMLEQRLKAYFIYGFEPEYDLGLTALGQYALQHAELVVSINAFSNKNTERYASIMLPLAPFSEMAGTYVNVEGKWQLAPQAVAPQGESRPGWKILRVMANFLGLDGFDYTAREPILAEIKANLASQPACEELPLSLREADAKVALASIGNRPLRRIAHWPLYRGDALLRRSLPLQATMRKQLAAVRVNAKLAAELKLKAGDSLLAKQEMSEIVLPLVIDNSVADHAVAIAAGLEETAGFGEAFGEIELTKVTT